MRLSVDQSPAHFEMVNRLLESHFSHERGDRIIASIRDDGTPAGIAVLSNVAPGERAELSFWIDQNHGLAGKDMLRAIFGAVFTQWQCKRLSAIVRHSNKHSQRVVRKLGFTLEASLPAWYGAEGGFLYRMFPADCRWI